MKTGERRILNRRLGPYVLIEKLATGGMAELFLAMKAGPGAFEKLVVAKCIIPQYNDNPDFIRLFYDEASIAGRFNHPNVIHTFDVDIYHGTHYMVMEYMFGRTLTELIERGEELGEAFPLDLAVQMTIDVCEGLFYVHTLGDSHGRSLRIVHRDISPQNIFVTFDGQTKVFDFGIAQMRRDDDGDSQQGMLAGKYAYMSPEQCRGELIDARSDVFSLGIVLFELATGTRLFKRDNHIRTLRAIAEDPIPSPSNHVERFPRYLERIIMKALARDLDARYRDALEMSEDLRKYLKISGAKPTIQLTSAFAKRLFQKEIEAFRAFTADARAQIESQHGRRSPLDPASDTSNEPATSPPPRPVDQPPPEWPLPSATPAAPLPSVIEAETEPDADLDLTWVEEQTEALRGQTRNMRVLASVLALLVCASTGLAIYLAVGAAQPDASTTPRPTPRAPEAVAPAPAASLQLRVTSTPSGAAITLNGEPTSRATPATFRNLSPELGIDLSLVLEGHEAFSQSFAPTRGLFAFHANLIPTPSGASPATTPSPPSPVETASITLSSDPEGASIRLDGARLDAITPATIEVPRDGASHVLWLDAPRHVTAVVTLDEDAPSTLEVKLDGVRASRMATLDVRVQPRSARVSLDGVFVGHAPFEGLRLDGKRVPEIELIAEGHVAFRAKLSLEKGAAQRVFAWLPETDAASADDLARLSIDVTPECEVILDGVTLGTSPLALVTLPAGEHTFEFEQPTGGLFHRHTLTLEPGSREGLRVEVPRNTLSVRSTPSGASVFINDVPRGETPFTEELFVGTHRVRVEREGHPPQESRIEITPEAPVEIEIEL